jgi:hypothetical protein
MVYTLDGRKQRPDYPTILQATTGQEKKERNPHPSALIAMLGKIDSQPTIKKERQHLVRLVATQGEFLRTRLSNACFVCARSTLRSDRFKCMCYPRR